MQEAIYALIEAGASMVGFSMAIFGVASIFGQETSISKAIAGMSLALAALFGLSIIAGAFILTNELGLFFLSQETIQYLEKFCVLWFLLGTAFGILFGVYILARFIVLGGRQPQ